MLSQIYNPQNQTEEELMEIDKIIEGMDLMSQIKSMPEILFET